MSDDEETARELAKKAVHRAWRSANDLFIERSRLTQVVLAGVVSAGVGVAAQFVVPTSLSFPGVISTFSDGQLILALIGVVVGQTMIQTRRINQAIEAISGMDQTTTRSDGGRDLPPRDDEGKFTDEGTSGGGALGGAIAGAALGSSYGPAGTVAGALFGAILGDALEEQSQEN